MSAIRAAAVDQLLLLGTVRRVVLAASVDSGSGALAPALSFVVIGFNEAVNAPRAVAAILAQDTPVPFEVLYIDDGSTDGTVDALEAAFSLEPRLRIVDLGVNRGRGAARVAGIQAASAPLIAFVDSDISLPVDWASRCLASIDDFAAVGGIAVPDGDCAVLHRLFSPTPRVKAPSASVPGSNVMFHAHVLHALPFPSTRLGEDFRYSRQLAAAGFASTSIEGLRVDHHEMKSYRQGLSWLYASGVDATSLMVEFGELRAPDVAWMLTLASSLGAGTLVARRSGLLPAFAAAAAVAAVATSAVAAAHAYSRFDPAPARVRFAAATAANVPLMGAYFAGRTAGAFRLAAARLGTRHG